MHDAEQALAVNLRCHIYHYLGSLIIHAYRLGKGISLLIVLSSIKVLP